MKSNITRIVALAASVLISASMLGACARQQTTTESDGDTTGSAASGSSNSSSSSSSSSGNAESGESGSSDGLSTGSADGSGESNGTSDGSTSAETGSVASDTSTSTDTPIQLTIWESESNEALLTAAVEYNALHPNVTVTISQHDKTSINDLKMGLAAGSAPDIICMDQAYVTASGSLNYLVDLATLGATSQESKFVASCWSSIAYDGKVFGMPFDANTVCLTYNQDILDQANASVPTTYDEMKTTANKIKSMFGTTVYAYTAPYSGWNDDNWTAFQYFFWLWRMGGEILSDDMTTAAFNSTEGVEALQMLVNLRSDGLASPEYLHNEFFAGSVGMIDMGSWNYDLLFGSDAKANFNVALMPVLKEGVAPYSGLGLYCYCVTTGSSNAQAAYNFVQYYCTSDTYQLQYCTQNDLIPSLISAQSDSFYSSSQWQTMIQQLSYSKYRPSVPNWNRMETYIANAIEVAVKGEATPKEALDAAAKNVNNLLGQS